MRNLWITLPPLLADSFGLIEIVKNSDGCGVIDDSGEFRLDGGHGHGGHGGRRQGGGHSSFKGGGHGGKERGGPGPRVVVSSANSQAVTTGTRDMLLDACQEARMRYDPSFVLFSAGPCGAMIGTDLAEIAETVSSEYQIPAAAVDLTGQKAYDVGISRTTEALAKLLADPAEKVPGAVNILGASQLDWSAEDIQALGSWASRQGCQVLAQPGGPVTGAQLEAMGQAQLNLAVTVSGLAAARYLQTQFGTPYVAAAPFGAEQCRKLVRSMDGGGVLERAGQTEAEALVIGEQFMANAIREALVQKGIVAGADVTTFFTLDKEYAQNGDRRIRGESDARELLNSGKYRLIVADPLLRPLLENNCQWIDLPHRALNLYTETKGVSLMESGLDNWLESHC